MRRFSALRWVAGYGVAVLLLALTDAAIVHWRPSPERLPEAFSGAYLQRVVQDLGPHARPVVFVGDSVLWGYRVAPDEAAATLIERRLAPRPSANLAYEGGSPVNAYALLRYLIASGLRPAAIVLNVNIKVFNPADSAYKRLHPALERVALPFLDQSDRATLALTPGPRDLNARLGALMERTWALYRFRIDIRQALFGRDDMATALRDAIQRRTGAAQARERAHRPTAERFLGTYDLTPLAGTNVSLRYLQKTLALARGSGIAVVAFLTPTNHRLLHDYIDSPDYDANLQRARAAIETNGGRFLNLDRAIPAGQFLDNDHLTVEGNRRLAALLYPAIRSALR